MAHDSISWAVHKNESICNLSALKLLSKLKEVMEKDLMFHQSGGCCDGSTPMCFPAKENFLWE